MFRRWPPKNPNDTLDYGLNWGAKRLDADEMILTSEWAVDQGTVTIKADPAPSIIDGKRTRCYVSGGTPDEVCLLKNTITTSKSRTRTFSGKLRIKARG